MSALLDLNEEHPVGLVVASKASAPGLARARRRGIPTVILEKKPDWQKLLQKLEDLNITHIFLTGFMKVVPEEFLRAWKKPILNVHPSLLPKYPGLRAIDRAKENNDDIGVTVHNVIPAVDAGETVRQRKVFLKNTYSHLSLEQIEFYMHLTEYDLVRQSMKEASCWT